MALPLSAILPIFWPGQTWGTENDDVHGNGTIAFWGKENTLPEPSVEEVRAREPEVVAVLAERDAAAAKADLVAAPEHLNALSEAIHAALAELKPQLSAETRAKIDDLLAKKPVDAAASVEELADLKG